MAFDETVHVVCRGGFVIPISHVTGAFTPSNVVIYDGETYRDTLDSGYLGRATVTGSASLIVPWASPGLFEGADDAAQHVAPRYKGKQRTLVSFPRTVSGAAGFTHVIWYDNVIGTGSHAPYRIGQPATDTSDDA